MKNAAVFSVHRRRLVYASDLFKFSDTIFSLKYDKAKDILWIGTDTGLNQYFVSGSTVVEKDTEIPLGKDA